MSAIKGYRASSSIQFCMDEYLHSGSVHDEAVHPYKNISLNKCDNTVI